MTLTLDHLTNKTGVAHREMSIRAESNSESRSFTGIAVPWNDVVTIRTWFGDFTEEVERGAVVESDGAKIFWRHGEIIGHVTAHRDVDAGWEIDGLIAETRQGNDAYALLRSGSLDKLSIGFEPVEWREDENGHITYTKIRVREVSLVPHPAYDKAAISEVRSMTPKGNPPMNDVLTRADLAPLNDQLQTIERSLSLLQPPAPTGPAVPQFRSMGEFVKAIAAGDQDAAEFHRAYTGGTTADAIVKDTFIGEFIHLVEERRRIINTFQRGTLPAQGNNVEYGKLVSDTTKVEKQAAEGDNLAFGKVKIGTGTAPVETYGGYTELTLQAIQRSSVSVLNTTFKAMALRYAKATENAFRTLYKSTIAANLAGDVNDDWLALPANPTPDQLLSLIVDASLLMDDKGFLLNGMHASVDQFKKLISLKDGDNRLMTVQGTGVNQIGTLNLKGVTGQLASVEVSLLPGAAANTLSFYDAQAFETLESPGAPAQLQDENIINLSKAFSIYGYAAFADVMPGAIIPTKPAA